MLGAVLGYRLLPGTLKVVAVSCTPRGATLLGRVNSESRTQRASATHVRFAFAGVDAGNVSDANVIGDHLKYISQFSSQYKIIQSIK